MVHQHELYMHYCPYIQICLACAKVNRFFFLSPPIASVELTCLHALELSRIMWFHLVTVDLGRWSNSSSDNLSVDKLKSSLTNLNFQLLANVSRSDVMSHDCSVISLIWIQDVYISVFSLPDNFDLPLNDLHYQYDVSDISLCIRQRYTHLIFSFCGFRESNWTTE